MVPRDIEDKFMRVDLDGFWCITGSEGNHSTEGVSFGSYFEVERYFKHLNELNYIYNIYWWIFHSNFKGKIGWKDWLCDFK
jgi:hypothetical protein